METPLNVLDGSFTNCHGITTLQKEVEAEKERAELVHRFLTYILCHFN